MIERMINSHTEVILALDVENRSKAESILEKTGEQLRWVKIGLQTYLRDGPEFLRDVASMGKFIFWILNYMIFRTPWQRQWKALPNCLLKC